MDEGKGHFAFPDVLASGLPRAVAFPKVEEVVLDLKGEAHAFAQSPHPLDGLVVRPSRGRSARTTRGKEGGGLAPDDVEVDFLCDVQAPCLFNLEQLTLAHLPHGARSDFQQVISLGIHGCQKPSRQEVVPDKHGNLLLPEGLDAENATSKRAFVDHIVVHQSCGVQEFDEGRGGVGTVGGVAIGTHPSMQACAQEHKHGTHLLALASKDVTHDGVEEDDVGGNRLTEFGLERIHVPLQKGLHTFQIGSRFRHDTKVARQRKGDTQSMAWAVLLGAGVYLRIMLRSMTGYGKAEGAVGSRKYTVEVRSLNGKNLDLSVRMPSVLKEKEMALRKELGARIVRGKSDVAIHFEADASDARHELNVPVIDQ